MKIELAQAYVPYQEKPNFYPFLKGFCEGTIFPELHQPYKKREHENKEERKKGNSWNGMNY